MSPSDAKHTAALVNHANWPKGVEVIAKVQDELVWVTVSAPGVDSIDLTFCQPIGLFGWRNLRDIVDDVAFEMTYRDGPEPEPYWLTETLRLIAARTAGRPKLGRLAAQIARCLEFDDLPVPQVVDHEGITIVMRWHHEGRILEIGAAVDGEVKIVIANIYEVSFCASYPCYGTDFKDRGQAWANVRAAVLSVLGREPVTRQVMEAEVSS